MGGRIRLAERFATLPLHVPNLLIGFFSFAIRQISCFACRLFGSVGRVHLPLLVLDLGLQRGALLRIPLHLVFETLLCPLCVTFGRLSLLHPPGGVAFGRCPVPFLVVGGLNPPIPRVAF